MRYIRVRGLLNGLLHPWAWRTGARHGQNLVDVDVHVHVVWRAPEANPQGQPGHKEPPTLPHSYRLRPGYLGIHYLKPFICTP